MRKQARRMKQRPGETVATNANRSCIAASVCELDVVCPSAWPRASLSRCFNTAGQRSPHPSVLLIHRHEPCGKVPLVTPSELSQGSVPIPSTIRCHIWTCESRFPPRPTCRQTQRNGKDRILITAATRHSPRGLSRGRTASTCTTPRSSPPRSRRTLETEDLQNDQVIEERLPPVNQVRAAAGADGICPALS